MPKKLSSKKSDRLLAICFLDAPWFKRGLQLATPKVCARLMNKPGVSAPAAR